MDRMIQIKKNKLLVLFWNDRIALFGGVSILLFAFISVFGKWVIPDDSPNSDREFPELALLPPGTTIRYHVKVLADKSEEWIPLNTISKNNEIGNDSTHTLNLEQGRLVVIRHWLGTDTLGRDVLSRLIAGARVSFFIGLMAVCISVLVGTCVGAIAGYFRGITDSLLSWFMHVMWSIPTLLMVLVLTLLIGKGLSAVFLAVGLTMWVDVARIVRGQMLSLREKEFAEAGKALGFSHFRILLKHLLPNTFSSILVVAASNFASAILVESGLSFLGFGVQPPTPSWGSMIEQHKNYLLTGLPWLALAPGLCIVWLVLSFTFVGNALKNLQE